MTAQVIRFPTERTRKPSRITEDDIGARCEAIRTRNEAMAMMARKYGPHWTKLAADLAYRDAIELTEDMVRE